MRCSIYVFVVFLFLVTIGSNDVLADISGLELKPDGKFSIAFGEFNADARKLGLDITTLGEKIGKQLIAYGLPLTSSIEESGGSYLLIYCTVIQSTFSLNMYFYRPVFFYAGRNVREISAIVYQKNSLGQSPDGKYIIKQALDLITQFATDFWKANPQKRK